MCHAIFTCGSNRLGFGSCSNHCLCSHLLVPNQAGLRGRVHALWNSTGAILMSNTASQSSLAGEQLPRLFCAVSQLRCYPEPAGLFQLPDLTVDSLQEGDFYAFSVRSHPINTLVWIIFVFEVFSRHYCASSKSYQNFCLTLLTSPTLCAPTEHFSLCVLCPIPLNVCQIKQRVLFLWTAADRRADTPAQSPKSSLLTRSQLGNLSMCS